MRTTPFRYLATMLLGLVSIAPLPALAWDSTGHRIIASIAYSHLTPLARQKADALTTLLDPDYPPSARFLYAATLPDQWRENDKQSMGWHFIDLPWSTDNTPAVAAATPNSLTILQTSITTLANPTAKNPEKARALAYIAHLVGDIHQPLHCINRFSQLSPHGDLGANLLPIHSKYADNLHAYWDQSARLLLPPNRPYPPNNQHIRQLVQTLETAYPEPSLRRKIADLTIMDWAMESFNLAQSVAYALPNNSAPTPAYQQTQRAVAAQQMVLAGYRLAAILNQLWPN